MIQPAYRPLGKLLYNLKGIDPKHANGFGIRASYQGDLSGKRAGSTTRTSEQELEGKASTKKYGNRPLGCPNNHYGLGQ